MKKITLLLLLISASVFSQAQKWDQELSKDATTEKEYNYLTKGIRTQEENGLDIIDGYVLNECNNEKVGEYNFNIQYLVNKTTNKYKAMSVIITSYTTGKKIYICIPVNNKSLTEKYWMLLNVLDPPLLKIYAYKMSDLFMWSTVVSSGKK